MSSFKVFGINVNGTQTEPSHVNKSELEDLISTLLNIQHIHKVVVIKKWL